MQKPSVRPGSSPRERPTGAPQSEREQNRLRSGTSGSSSTIARGSGRGTWGTDTSPAPSRARPEEPAEEPELRTDTERPVDAPDSSRDRRPDTERRDRADCEAVREERAERELPLSGPLLPPPTWVGAERARPLPETTGASPQVPQYSSPPPMSSYDPSQPGRWHGCPA
ncbi:hypothetical protein GCM10010335_63520 [Streptomyces galbus]|nr:hypothetical protein GCM10010335_63520 [Streptomyces galbus]